MTMIVIPSSSVHLKMLQFTEIDTKNAGAAGIARDGKESKLDYP